MRDDDDDFDNELINELDENLSFEDEVDDDLSGYEGVENATSNEDTKEDLDPLEAGILLYENRKYAVGLTWLTSDEDDDKNLVKERANRLNSDFYSSRNAIASQHGFGYLGKGHKIGMNAAASMAADALIGEWHGIFLAENGWWYVAVHSDTIAPDGDLFFHSEEHAYNHFSEKQDSHQWPRSYAPDSWNIKNSNGEISLSRLFDDMPSTPLKPCTINAVFGGKRNKEVVFAVGGLFLLILFASIIAKETLPGLIPQTSVTPGLSVSAPEFLSAPPQERIKEDKSKNIIENLDRAYLPNAQKIVEMCLENFSDLALAFPGWSLNTMRCRNNLAEANWVRTNGNLNSLRAHIDRFPFGVSKSFSGDRTFIASRVMGSISEYNQEVFFLEREAAILLLNNRFANIGNMSVNDVIPPPRQQRAKRNRRGAVSRLIESQAEEPLTITLEELPYLAVTIKAKTPPNLIAANFDIPGFVFDMIQWKIKDQIWEYNARLILKLDENTARNLQRR